MHPLEFIRGLLGTRVSVVLRSQKEIKGVLKMFDEHVNLMIKEEEEEKSEEKGARREKEILFVRSDSVLGVRGGEVGEDAP